MIAPASADARGSRDTRDAPVAGGGELARGACAPERVRLLSPEVGWFTCASPPGTVLSAGARAGFLIALGKSFELVVPDGVEGLVGTPRPERVHAPVGYGDLLYELEPLAAAKTGARGEAAPADAAGRLVVRAAQSGRFYHRPAPGEPAFAAAGMLLAEGAPIGLIEVMKTFTHVPYRREKAAPERVRVVRYAAGDGADVRRGDALLEIEPADAPGTSATPGGGSSTAKS